MLGIRHVLAGTAVGSCNPDFQNGDLILLTDLIDTGFGAKAEGNELKQKALNMLPFGNKLKLPKGGAIVGNILKSGVAAAIGIMVLWYYVM